ncbi:LysR family transcriptional regulator [Paraburkholderia agricolaris]|uniref:LysR family transcriptional regulator n=1 Tax=Paraburkholderia agricolaris TaxID=2152888 RepID=UPI0038B8E648
MRSCHGLLNHACRVKNGWRLCHLRCFLALAEERHFVHSAARLHIEQSRVIKELEEDLARSSLCVPCAAPA